MHLTVVNPFKNYVRGDVIVDQDVIAEVQKTHPHHVTQHYPHHEDFFKTDAELAADKAPTPPVLSFSDTVPVYDPDANATGPAPKNPFRNI